MERVGGKANQTMTPEDRSALEDHGAQLIAMSTGISESHPGMRRALGWLVLQTEAQVQCGHLGELAGDCHAAADEFREASYPAHTVVDSPNDPLLLAAALMLATHS